MGSKRVIVLLSVLVSLVQGVPLSHFYPYGSHVDKLLPTAEDAPSSEFSLKVPVKFFDEIYDLIYVNKFGCLTFRAPIEQFMSIAFPLDYPSIAAFYANVDITGTGTISARESQEPDLLQRANEEVFKSYPRFANEFNATSLFIATWFKVGYFYGKSDKVNTFQIVVITDGMETFVQFFYADHGIQWLQGASQDTTKLSDSRAQAGLMQDGIVYNVLYSGTDQAYNLDKISNTDLPGVWIFRVGNLENLGKVEAPVPNFNNINDPSCAAAMNYKCHSQADCIDEARGHCCICKKGYFGNGINCLPEGSQLRVKGKLSLDVNGVQSNDVHLQAYVYTADGRSYTALTNVPPQIGSSLQLSSFLANSIAWLFAKSVSAPNGYQVTGGIFNYSSDIIYSTGQRIAIQQQFFGHDVFDQLTLEGSIKGTSPPLANGVNVQVEDHMQQEFTHSSTGLFQSHSSHTYRLEGTSPSEITVRFKQNIEYTEGCETQARNITNTRIKSQRNLIIYEGRENILRISSTNKLHSLQGGDDPCRGFQCVVNSSCIVEDDRATCVCNKGFQQLYSQDGREEDIGCFDVNECNDGTATCHQNAICFNEVGSYSCQCKPGFAGNGRQCSEAPLSPSPSISPCELDPQACNPPHSTCSDPTNYLTCSCDAGFQKDYLDDHRVAFVCTDIDECQYNAPCDKNSDCVNQLGTYSCPCKKGYTREANGFNCQSERNGDGSDQGTNSVTCVEDELTGESHCECSPGYIISSGNECIPFDKLTCSASEECAPNAECSFNAAVGSNLCVCLEGFDGDGSVRCTSLNNTVEEKICSVESCWCPSGYRERGEVCEKDVPDSNQFGSGFNNVPCETTTACHPNAQCVYISQEEQYFCQCNAGYEGDGAHCTLIEESCVYVDNCHPLAVCKTIQSSTGTIDICECQPGFVGDGKETCTPISNPNNTIPCTKADEPISRMKEDGTEERYFEPESPQCGKNAYCVENSDSNIFECVCHEGFYRDGDYCRSGKIDDFIESECATPCHANAQCVTTDDLDEFKDQAKCQCNLGYTGDGISECTPESLGCNVVHNCHADAKCAYNATSAGFRCKCQEGYIGNGIECHPEKTCTDDISLCSENASCVIADKGHYHCACNEGYTGNGFQCKAKPKKESNFLLVNQGMTMIRLPYQPTRYDPGRPINVQADQILIGIAIDCVEGQVYWSAAGKNSIKRSYYDGKNVEDIVVENVKFPEGLAIDWVERKIFWTDSGLQTISVANLDVNQKPTVLVSKGLVNPRGIAVDPYNRKLFWSDWNRQDPKIEWSNLDGSDRQIFYKSPDLKLPNSLAIDFSTDELCWVDADVKSVECMSIQTRQKRIIYSNCTYPFGLTITDDRYYWTNWRTARVESTDRRGSKAESINMPVVGSTYVYGIVAVPSKCP